MQQLGDTDQFKDRNMHLVGADLATLKGWTAVPNFVLETDTISAGAKLTYAMLLKYAREQDYCFPGQTRLGEDMGVTRQSVNTYLNELKKARLVKVERRGQGRTNIYHVTLKPGFWGKHD